MRVDGFASLEDHFGGGTIVTKPLIVDGERLRVNTNSQYGELRVELLDQGGETIPGFTSKDCVPIQADSTNTTVRWSDGVTLPDLAERPFRLKFYLNNTKLYSFWID